MAAKTPTLRSTLQAAPTTETYVDPATGNITTAGTVTRINRPSKLCRVFYFPDIDDTDTWTSGITNVVDWALRVSSAGTARVTHSAGVFTFGTSATDQTIFLTVWSGS